MMILKIEFAKNRCLSTIGLLRRLPLLGLIKQESIIKTLIFCDLTILPLLGFWNRCLSTIGLLRRLPLLGLIKQESIIKTLIFCDLTILPLLGFWPIFLFTFSTPGCKRYVMQQCLTFLCTNINETRPSPVIFLRVDQFYILRFLFCRV